MAAEKYKEILESKEFHNLHIPLTDHMKTVANGESDERSWIHKEKEYEIDITIKKNLKHVFMEEERLLSLSELFHG